MLMKKGQKVIIINGRFLLLKQGAFGSANNLFGVAKTLTSQKLNVNNYGCGRANLNFWKILRKERKMGKKVK
ncbi:MAG: hypothetical protein CM15mP106_5380 [Candidatus Neomarinimicrobiota bacterium]|nr:MAG: hypothetical protein CM15mP106_5380 [Candidatus Neomarinimicrobiota bacterium]